MRWIVGIVAVLLLALLVQSGLLAYALYVLLALLVVSRFWTGGSLRLIRSFRTLSAQEVEAGASVIVRVGLEYTGRWPLPWLLMEDLLPDFATNQRPPRLRVKGRRMAIHSLSAGSDVELRYTLEMQSRGYYPVGPLILETGDLFGLERQYRAVAAPRWLLVLPKVVPLLGFDIASRRPVGEIRLTHRLFEDPTRIAGVRRYEPGDPLNRVHWKATARTGVLHSKVYDSSALAGAVLLVDFHRSGYPARGEPTRSDLVATCAASLANALDEIGQPFGLMTNAADAAVRVKQSATVGETQTRAELHTLGTVEATVDARAPMIADVGRGTERVHFIRQLLARAELHDGLTFAELVREVAPRMPRSLSVICLLPRVDDTTAATLGGLKRQGFAVSAVLVMIDERERDDAVSRLLGQSVRDVRLLNSADDLPMLAQRALTRSAVALALP